MVTDFPQCAYSSTIRWMRLCWKLRGRARAPRCVFAAFISFGHRQESIQSEKEGQEIAEACRRLIKTLSPINAGLTPFLACKSVSLKSSSTSIPLNQAYQSGILGHQSFCKGTLAERS
jgi:hypothetical protein